MTDDDPPDGDPVDWKALEAERITHSHETWGQLIRRLHQEQIPTKKERR